MFLVNIHLETIPLRSNPVKAAIRRALPSEWAGQNVSFKVSGFGLEHKKQRVSLYTLRAHNTRTHTHTENNR